MAQQTVHKAEQRFQRVPSEIVYVRLYDQSELHNSSFHTGTSKLNIIKKHPLLILYTQIYFNTRSDLDFDA